MEVADTYKEEALRILQEKNKLCFEGGGVLGYAYAGAMIRLTELGGCKLPITHAVGASVGSIASVALASGASAEYIKDKILGMNLQRFKDGGNIFSRFIRLICRYGSHKGDEIETFVGEILQDLVGDSECTFQKLYELKNTVLTVPYVSTRYKTTKYASHLTEPDLKIKQAVRWSSTIPLFFQAGRLQLGKKLEDLLVDGGVTDNYPIHVLRDENRLEVLGFKLINTGEEETKDHGIPKNLVDYVFRLVDILREQALRYHVNSEDWKLTCKIDVGNYKTTDFDLTEDDKLWLYNSGVAAVDRHLEEIETMLRNGTYVNHKELK